MSDAIAPGVGILCGMPEPEEFARDRWIAVGFGAAYVTRDGVEILDGEALIENDGVTGADAEALASRDPDHVWEIVIVGPLSGATYRREGREIGRWLCVKRDAGFA